LFIDRRDTLYVGDTGNNRVVHYLKPASVVNAATFQSSVPVGLGALATLFGSGLSPDAQTAQGSTWSTVFDNREVVFNDQYQAPIYYVGLGQINFQVPSNLPTGTGRVAVRMGDTEELLAGGAAAVAATSPGIFTLNAGGQGAIENQDYSINGPSNPATVGSTIIIYGTGQGLVSPPVADGIAASSASNTVAVPTSDPAACLVNQQSMCVAIGSTWGNVTYSGLAPGLIGVWQINVQVPKGTLTGNAVPIRVVIDGTPSNLVTVAIK
jgi:uncharacterized protein (TIGR03437 family)